MAIVSNTSVPVIFIHKGYPDYLDQIVSCAEHFNNRVMILGDDANSEIRAGEWYRMSDYQTPLCEELKRVYIHCSTNSKGFELICIERYFILLEFMKKKSLNECFMIDSDVLLFGKMEELLTEDFDVGGGNGKMEANPCVLYWKISALESFVLFCLEQYRNKEKWRNLYETYNDMRRGKRHKFQGNISDMLLLKCWVDAGAYRWKEFYADKADYVIDGNINENTCGEENDISYRMNRIIGIKKYVFKNGIPYVIDYEGRKKRVLAIHCQGYAKKYINLLYNQRFGIQIFLQYCLSR